MILFEKAEQTVKGWFKDVPHLPGVARVWLVDNIWWIAAIFAVATAVGTLGLVVSLFDNLATLSSPFVSYYASPTFVAWSTLQTGLSLGFTAVSCALLGFSIKPLKDRQKSGWNLLFAAWLVGVVAIVIGAIATLSILGFLTNIIFGALCLAITAYLLFELDGKFAHVERSRAVKSKK